MGRVLDAVCRYAVVGTVCWCRWSWRLPPVFCATRFRGFTISVLICKRYDYGTTREQTMTVRRIITTAVLAAATAVVLAGCGTHPATSTTGSSAAPAGNATVTVAYLISGSAKTVDLTLQTATGQSQQNDLKLPVKNRAGTDINFEATPGQFVYVSAQNQGSYGTVTCEITVDGVPVSTNTSSGGYSIATCSGHA